MYTCMQQTYCTLQGHAQYFGSRLLTVLPGTHLSWRRSFHRAFESGDERARTDAFLALGIGNLAVSGLGPTVRLGVDLV
jgi:hypothetical protein